MKCFKHNSADAVAVCTYCGRALCPDCVSTPAAARIVCSTECGASLAREGGILQTLVDKSAQSAKASAFYCYLTAALSAGAAVAAWFMLPSPFLIYFTAACALVLLVAGLWYARAARKQSL